MRVRRLLQLGLLAGLLGGQEASPTVYRTVFSAITAATTSAPVQNIGQIQHVIKIEFPTATLAVTPIQVRLEGSYNNSDYFPITADVTSCSALTGTTTTVYAFTGAYGAYPYVRVNSLASTPGAKPMTVRYFGYVYPIIPSITLTADRYLF